MEYILNIEHILNKTNISKEDKKQSIKLMEDYFMESNESEKEYLLNEALRLDPNSRIVLLQYGTRLINANNQQMEYTGYMLLEHAFNVYPPIPIHSNEGKTLATMIARYNHTLHNYKKAEKYFRLANSSTFTLDNTNNVQLATLITGYSESVKDAKANIEKYNEKMDELLKKNLDFSFAPNHSYNFLMLSPFNFETYYEANIRTCMYKHYLLGKKIYPNLHYISPKIKKGPPSLPYKIGIASAFFRKNHSVISDFGGVIERLPRDIFDITLIYIYEHGKNDNPNSFLYPNEKHIIINTDTYEKDDWLNDARRQIEDLNLDLLFYLDSTMSTVIQRTMMSKLALKQAVSHGHPVTSGIPSNIMNYYISWGEAEIETAQEHYTEKLVLLRKGHMHQYYTPRIDLNGHSTLSGKRYANITREHFSNYGLTPQGNWYTCMQKSFKIHPEFDDFLAKICLGDKSAKIILQESLHEETKNIFKKRFKRFQKHVYFLPELPHHELIGLYNVSDVVLDSYYAGGCTTTREALEIGAIVVTLPGKYLGGRWSLAYYNIMGVLDLVAKDKQDYVNIALKYGTNQEENAKMKEVILDNVGKLFYSDEAVNSWVQVFEQIIQS
jgi:predicted O-linked N-acetylglucosamine transferase (SPINDLY family)